MNNSPNDQPWTGKRLLQDDGTPDRNHEGGDACNGRQQETKNHPVPELQDPAVVRAERYDGHWKYLNKLQAFQQGLLLKKLGTPPLPNLVDTRSYRYQQCLHCEDGPPVPATTPPQP